MKFISQFNLSTSLVRLVSRACVLGVCAALVACGSFGGKALVKKDSFGRETPESLYAVAKEELDSKGYTKAIELYEKVLSADALGTFGQQALIDTAYAQWKNDELVAALTTIERYTRQFPKGMGMPYALYMKGLIKFNDRTGLLAAFSKQDLSDRDPKLLREAFDAFSQLIEQYPTTTYAKDASDRQTFLVNSMAQHEVNVARFYLARKAPLAAISRAQDMLKQYSETPAQEEALGVIIEGYRQLGIPELQAKAEMILRTTYPNSEYLNGAVFTPKRKAFFSLW